MALLVTGEDLGPLVEGERFFEEAFRILEKALLREDEEAKGYASFLKFPLGAEGSSVQIFPLSSPAHGHFLRVSPVSASPRRPADGDFVVHLDRESGKLLALIATDDLSPMRTALPVGVACKYLVPEGARVLAMIGSGLQARYQLRAACHAVPSLEAVRAFSLTPENRERFAREMEAATGLNVEPVSNAREAVEGAEVVLITAASREPVIASEWVEPEALVTAIIPTGVPADLNARLIVPTHKGPEVRPSGWEPHPPYPMSTNGGIEAATISATLAEVMRGTAPARERPDEIVLYEVLGAAVWDAALLGWSYEWALDHKIGTAFDLSAV